MTIRELALLVSVCCLTWACDPDDGSGENVELATVEYALKVCADGPTTKGIDVSKWQGDIDWPKVAGAGIKFAFIRVSDGLNYPDPKFQYNWAEARAAGVVRGVYQYFRPSQDAVEQATYLLDQMGPLQEGDLPPVIDVETVDGQSAAKVIDQVAIWLETVEQGAGVRPLIYTSAGFWASLGTDGFTDYPLWVANWETDCPLMPDGWTEWVFWQTAADGTVAGIDEAVDLDVFNGDLAALQGFAVGEQEPEPEITPCPVAKTGYTVVEEDGPCGMLPDFANIDQYQSLDGHGGHAWWVPGAVPDPDYGNGINWMLAFEEGGTYELEVYLPAGLDQLTSFATYKIFHGGDSTKVVLDQAAGAGDWASLGTFHFVTGYSDQWVRLGDNYKPEEGPGKRILLDALRLRNTTGCDCATAGETQEHPCDGGGKRQRECDGCTWSDWSECSAGDDADGDLIADATDNCPADPNPEQEDSDDDGLGNACDPDRDGDGVPNGDDNCYTYPNQDQADGDCDGIGDACDTHPDKLCPDDPSADLHEQQEDARTSGAESDDVMGVFRIDEPGSDKAADGGCAATPYSASAASSWFLLAALCLLLAWRRSLTGTR
jgi:lysozyme